ncbi:hypothetical protein [Sulfitobacter sp. MF3-043]|uniref:hypothetical protein n=1 Tax=Sulfitobacter sediminivivens TaxID=3252902 RepID=UPI0036DE8ED6
MIASGEYRDYVRPPGRKNPLGLAAVRLGQGLLVSFVQDMEIDRVHELANGRQTFDAPTPPIPVKLGYYTRFPDAAGQIVRHADIYGLQAGSAAPAPGTQKLALACTEPGLAD